MNSYRDLTRHLRWSIQPSIIVSTLSKKAEDISWRSTCPPSWNHSSMDFNPNAEVIMRPLLDVQDNQHGAVVSKIRDIRSGDSDYELCRLEDSREVDI